MYEWRKQIQTIVDEIDKYEIGNMSQGKHLVIKLYDGYVQFIKWNWSGDWDEMHDYELLGEPLQAIGHLDSGWLGRKFSLKVICDEIRTVN